MSDLNVPDTRRRSRSKTPFVLRSQCDKDNCTETDHIHDHVKAAPTVETIVEEDAANTNTRAKTRNTRKTTSAATTTEASIASTQPSTAITEQQAVAVNRTGTVASHTSTTTVTTTSSVKTIKTTNRANAESASLSSTLRSSAISKEQSQNEQNTFFEENTSSIGNMQTSTPIRNTSHHNQLQASTITSPIVTAAIDTDSLDDHIAYREYRDAGEYWNKFPKTDYTYSRLSPHRRELAPGVVGMPNMSRRSLEHHHDRVDQMAQANPELESYIRTRYQTRQFAAQHRRKDAFYDSQDSQDELDVVNTSYRTTVTRTSSTSIFQRIIFVRWITTFVSWLSETITSRFRAHRHTNVYYTKVDQQGWFRRFCSAVSSSAWSVVQFVYLTISSVLFLDSWLLKTKSSSGSAKKRFLLLLLVVLPLLLLAGTFYLLDKPIPGAGTFVSLDRVFDPVHLSDVQALAWRQWDDLADQSADYWLALKALSQSSYESVAGVVRENLNV